MYCFIVEDTEYAAQTARDGEQILRPADPVAPEGMAFDDWYTEDGAPLFADRDGDGEADPVIARPDGFVTVVNVEARFVKGEATQQNPDEDRDDEAAQKPSDEDRDDEGTSSVSADAEPASPEGKPFGDEKDDETTQKPSPVGEGGTARSDVTDEVSGEDGVVQTSEQDAATGDDDEGTSSVSPCGEPEGAYRPDLAENSPLESFPGAAVSPEGKPFGDGKGDEVTQKPSPLGEGGSAIALTDEVSPNEGVDGKDDEATQKPSPVGEGGTARSDVTDEVPGEDGVTQTFEQNTDAEASPTPTPFRQSRTVKGVVVTVTAEAGAFPAGAELAVDWVPVYTRAYRDADAAVEALRDEDRNVAASYTFDIRVLDPGTKEELQPAEGCSVQVSFALAEVADQNLDTNVYHITEDGSGELSAEALDVSTEITPATGEATTATVETDGFSLYTVEFTYNTLAYVLPGGERVALSMILNELGLTGAPTAVAVSNAALFSASDATGEWVIESHAPFASTEWMKVTLNGVVYGITVTDAQSGACGEGVTWTLDGGALTISGTGEMYNYSMDDNRTPWYDSRGSITSVVIENGVTSLGTGVFCECYALTSVTIPDSVTSLEYGVF